MGKLIKINNNHNLRATHFMGKDNILENTIFSHKCEKCARPCAPLKAIEVALLLLYPYNKEYII